MQCTKKVKVNLDRKGASLVTLRRETFIKGGRKERGSSEKDGQRRGGGGSTWREELRLPKGGEDTKKAIC